MNRALAETSAACVWSPTGEGLWMFVSSVIGWCSAILAFAYVLHRLFPVSAERMAARSREPGGGA